mgnify:CR=1 FL=1
MALKRINADFEIYKVVEFDKFAIKSYNAVHNTNFKTMDIKDVNAKDYGVAQNRNRTYMFSIKGGGIMFFLKAFLCKNPLNSILKIM